MGQRTKATTLAPVEKARRDTVARMSVRMTSLAFTMEITSRFLDIPW